jgi:hypothetical protein
MISQYTCFDHGGIKIEANWNEAVSPGEVFRFTIDGKEALLDRAHLYQLLFLFGDDEQKEEMIPVKENRVKEITRLLKVKAKRDVKRGEIIAVPYTTFIPLGIYEKLRLTPLDNDRMERLVNKKAIT